MEEKRWAIIEELEKVTEENASNFLSPSVYGQAKVKGKFIRDENGKLVPVLVKTKRQASSFKSGKCIRSDKQKHRESGIISGLKKMWLSFFSKKV